MKKALFIIGLFLFVASVWAATPIIYFDSTGSDTAASGSGGTALSGTGASLNATAIVDLSADTPNLSGVATDGSAVLWVDTSSGKQYARITAFNDTTDTVTVHAAYAVTESGRNWGIGGARATLDHADSRTVFVDMEHNWVIALATHQTITSTIGMTVGPRAVVLISSTTGTRQTITNTANSSHFTFSDQNVFFKDLVFANSNATKTSATAIGAGGGNGMFMAENCVFGVSTNRLGYGMNRGMARSNIFINCEFSSCTLNAISTTQGDGLSLFGCYIHDTGGTAIKLNDSDSNIVIADNIIVRNSGKGIDYDSNNFQVAPKIYGNTIHANTSDGILLTYTASFGYLSPAVVINNNITGNGGYGVNTSGLTLSSDRGTLYVDYNNFGSGGTANTSGATNPAAINMSNNISVDPQYTNASGNNFAVGTNVKAKGYPDATKFVGANNSATTNYKDIGAAQRQESGSGGSMPYVQ